MTAQGVRLTSDYPARVCAAACSHRNAAGKATARANDNAVKAEQSLALEILLLFQLARGFGFGDEPS